jgi:hypothetical protein
MYNTRRGLFSGVLVVFNGIPLLLDKDYDRVYSLVNGEWRIHMDYFREDHIMARMVQCVKLEKELEGLEFVPFPNELGQRIYDNISKHCHGT